jgi:hypothetical protein
MDCPMPHGFSSGWSLTPVERVLKWILSGLMSFCQGYVLQHMLCAVRSDSSDVTDGNYMHKAPNVFAEPELVAFVDGLVCMSQEAIVAPCIL